MTFPFSTHNYLLRYWMAEGGVVPDEDVRLVVLPPPFMVESLAKGQVDGFCVGAPWNSVAVSQGLGRILHFGVDIFARAAEKVLAVRESFAEDQPSAVASLTRACQRAADFINVPENLDEVASLLARPDRVGVDVDSIRRTLLGRMRVAQNGAERESKDYLIVARGDAGRPDPMQAAWFYAQMLRWGQTRNSPESVAAAKRTFRADLYEAALGASRAQRRFRTMRLAPSRERASTPRGLATISQPFRSAQSNRPAPSCTAYIFGKAPPQSSKSANQYSDRSFFKQLIFNRYSPAPPWHAPCVFIPDTNPIRPKEGPISNAADLRTPRNARP